MKTDMCKCGGNKRIEYKQCRKCFLDYYKTRTHKLCKGCNKEKLIDEFRTKPDGRPRSRCRECEANSAKVWRKENPEEHKRRKKEWELKYPEKHRRGVQRRTWRKLGLDPNHIESLLINHNGLCEICNDPPSLYKDLSPDHSHVTKKFRGFLCYKCNLAIGQFRDRIDLLEKAILYLKKTI